MVSLNYKICLIGICPTKSVGHESHTLCQVSSVCHGYLIDSEKSTQCSLKFVWNVGHEFLRGLNLFWLVWLQRVVLLHIAYWTTGSLKQKSCVTTACLIFEGFEPEDSSVFIWSSENHQSSWTSKLWTKSLWLVLNSSQGFSLIDLT